jgi:haloacetate dehalogenase
VIWGGRGIVNKFFDPITLWQAQCHGQVSGEVLPAGHFIPEECPNQTAELLNTFMQ